MYPIPMIPRSCDVSEPTIGGPQWLIWLVDDQGEVSVRCAPTLRAVVDIGRAYRAEWCGQVLGIEGPAGEMIPARQWSAALETAGPLPYIYRVELRSLNFDGQECVTVLWSTTDLDSAIRRRATLPDHLRRRSLIVSNAPDGASPLTLPSSCDT